MDSDGDSSSSHPAIARGLHEYHNAQLMKDGEPDGL
jgi:hypothetical protein